MSIFDAAMAYREEDVPLVVLAGADYGSGSSRDWAAKGTKLLGVRAVLAISYERIHRSNLIGMGVLPLQFPSGEDADSLGLTGEEVLSVSGPRLVWDPRRVTVTVEGGRSQEFTATADRHPGGRGLHVSGGLLRAAPTDQHLTPGRLAARPARSALPARDTGDATHRAVVVLVPVRGDSGRRAPAGQILPSGVRGSPNFRADSASRRHRLG